jgi:hypothetical protein
MEELTEQNSKLRSQLAKKASPVSIKVQAGDGAAAWPSAYRRARRVVGRPVRRFLRPEQ